MYTKNNIVRTGEEEGEGDDDDNIDDEDDDILRGMIY